MVTMKDPVLQLQEDLFGRYMAEDYFADVMILANEKGLILEEIEEKLKIWTSRNGKKGAAIVIDRPFRIVEHPEKPGPEFGLVIPVGVFEMPLTNRKPGGTGLTIEDLCSGVLSVSHGWRPSPEIGQLYVGESAVTPVVGTGRVIAAEVQLRTRMQLAVVSRVQRPVLAGTAASVQLSCNTPAATIYYTTDGSFPWSGNPSATRYGITLQTEDGTIIVTQDGDPLLLATAFSVDPGTRVRVAAFAEGKQGSDAAAATY
jgi:hypothetical protein